MLAPNVLLQDRYRIVRLLSQGGMGLVYLARDIRLDNDVALKETFFSGSNELRDQFHREARLLSRLRHPALPRVIDHFIDGSGQFLVMDYIVGQDLEGLLQANEGPLQIDNVLDWAEQLLDVLHYLHTQDEPVIHRDIKPANVKLTPQGRVILLDFGLAKGSSASLRMSFRAATPAYAPLEQIMFQGTDSRSDLYALAVTLYHLMTGELPPIAYHRRETVWKGLPDPLISPNKLNPQVSAGIANVLTRAMSLQIEDRPQSAAEMLEMLRHERHLLATGRQVQDEELRRRQEAETIIAESEHQERARNAAKVARQKKLEEQRKRETQRLKHQEEQDRKTREEAERLRRVQEIIAKEEQERIAKEEAEPDDAYEYYCVDCRGIIAHEDKVCPHCGADTSKFIEEGEDESEEVGESEILNSSNLSPAHAVKPKRPVMRHWISIVGIIVIAFVVLYFIVPFRLVKVEGVGMSPALNDGDRIIVSEDTDELSRGDIVVFSYPADTTKSFTKRIVGLPGESIRIDLRGQLFINGRAVEEAYVAPEKDHSPRAVPEQTLEADHYYVMGDNRDASNDSRSFGAVSKNLIYGKVLIRYWPSVK
ncbi:MAG TPA: signal peptidase I [Blastocatellia bacterium]|nr:signal peptidase I [Blastocatellia bacterium]